jgi:hypothetical protein
MAPACWLRSQIGGVAPVQARAPEQSKRFDIVSDGAARARILVHEQRERRPARQRL